MDNNYDNMSLFDFLALCFKKFSQFLIWCGNGFIFLANVCRSRWYIILTGIAIGFLFALVWAMPYFTRYCAVATINFPDNMKYSVEQGLEHFAYMSPKNKHNLLGIPYDIQKRTKAIAYYNCIDIDNDSKIDFIDYDNSVSPKDTDYNILQDCMIIRIKMVGSEDFHYYEKALCKFFNQNEKYKINAQRWRESKKRLIEETNYEIARTDSFVNHDYFKREHNLLVIDSFSLGQQNLLHYKDMNELRYYREYILEQLSRTPNVINFQTPFTIKYLLPSYKFIISSICGFCIALILSLIIDRNHSPKT